MGNFSAKVLDHGDSYNQIYATVRVRETFRNMKDVI